MYGNSMDFKAAKNICDDPMHQIVNLKSKSNICLERLRIIIIVFSTRIAICFTLVFHGYDAVVVKVLEYPVPNLKK